ncbi:MAG TPA: acetate--CoA ligase [Solirubrobacteraceae bacterium]|nr:acetate--CoA ligase [Solirubrobacteraceae bacterium]
MSAHEQSLDERLEELLSVARFEPPASFAAEALVGEYEQPADWVGAWEERARALDWASEWETALDDSNPPFYKWFAGGTLNASHNCLDRHVQAGLGERVAYHWRGEQGEERDVTYAQLLADTQRFANALKARGVGQGDVVGIYLPMIPEVVVAMLACARIGAAHNVVFGGFSAESVAERMEFSDAKLLVTVDGARRKGRTAPIKAAVDAVLPELPCVVVRHAGIDAPMAAKDAWWDDALAAADPECPAEPLDAETPLFVLYTSGSTAKPKGIVHTTGGYLTQAAWTHRYVFDLKPETDVYWCAADVGWVTGHTYIVYGPLLNAATSVMWEGAPDYPHQGIWWELCERYGVTILYTAPTAIRTFMKWGVEHVTRHDLSKLRLLGSVGEPINPKAWLWYSEVVGGGRCPVVDTWWQTETGGIMITTLPGAQYAKPGSAGLPLPGIDAAVLDEAGEEVPDGTQGLLALRRPWPGMLRTLFRDDDRFVQTYWSRWGPRTYLVGDASRRDADDGYFWVIGRVDDVINVSGHRLSTAEIESAIVSHPRVAESAVIGQVDDQTGQAITAFVTLQGEVDEGGDGLVEEIRDQVSVHIGKFARPSRVIWAGDLPKTRSGKIMRRLLRDIAEGRELGDVTTLRDPDVMARLEEKVRERQASGEDG